MSHFAYFISPEGNHCVLTSVAESFEELENGFLWMDIDPKDVEETKDVVSRLHLESSLSEVILDRSQRPRLEVLGDHIFISLRGVNFVNEDTPEDMVNLRMILSHNRLLTFHSRPMKTLTKLKSQVDKGFKMASVSGLFVKILKMLNDLMHEEIEEMQEEISLLEEASLEETILEYQERLSGLRRHIIGFQKHLVPQASVIQALSQLSVRWVRKRDRAHLKNQAERLSSMAGELEHLKQRATVLQEEIKSTLSDRMNQNMYRLTIVATILLPLSLFAGLMGANVGGVPFVENPFGFWVMCAVTFVIGAGTFGVMKMLKWF